MGSTGEMEEETAGSRSTVPRGSRSRKNESRSETFSITGAKTNGLGFRIARSVSGPTGATGRSRSGVKKVKSVGSKTKKPPKKRKAQRPGARGSSRGYDASVEVEDAEYHYGFVIWEI